MEHLELELEAHSWWFCSTHEYCKTTKYELQTPSGSDRMRSLLFQRAVSSQRRCLLQPWILFSKLDGRNLIGPMLFSQMTMGWNYVGEPFGSGVFPVKNSVEILLPPPVYEWKSKNKYFSEKLQNSDPVSNP